MLLYFLKIMFYQQRISKVVTCTRRRVVKGKGEVERISCTSFSPQNDFNQTLALFCLRLISYKAIAVYFSSSWLIMSDHCSQHQIFDQLFIKHLPRVRSIPF